MNLHLNKLITFWRARHLKHKSQYDIHSLIAVPIISTYSLRQSAKNYQFLEWIWWLRNEKDKDWWHNGSGSNTQFMWEHNSSQKLFLKWKLMTCRDWHSSPLQGKGLNSSGTACLIPSYLSPAFNLEYQRSHDYKTWGAHQLLWHLDLLKTLSIFWTSLKSAAFWIIW